MWENNKEKTCEEKLKRNWEKSWVKILKVFLLFLKNQTVREILSKKIKINPSFRHFSASSEHSHNFSKDRIVLFKVQKNHLNIFLLEVDYSMPSIIFSFFSFGTLEVYSLSSIQLLLQDHNSPQLLLDGHRSIHSTVVN